MKKDCITDKQFNDLYKLGFKRVYLDVTLRHSSAISLDYTCIKCYLKSIPIDLAIDWLRKKYNIVIYNSAAPYVDPTNVKKIKYGYRVKFCNVNYGWNFREYIGEPVWSYNIYAAKRMALTIAIKYAFELEKKKATVVKLPRPLKTKLGRSKKR